MRTSDDPLDLWPKRWAELRRAEARVLEIEREAVRAALVESEWSLRAAARRLGMTVSTLQCKLRYRLADLESERRRVAA